MQTSFFDSRRNGQLAGHFPLLCTIQRHVQTVDGYQQPNYEWVALTALTDIPCSVALISGQEVKGAENQYRLSTHRISLAGVYPDANTWSGTLPLTFPLDVGTGTATLRTCRAVIDGVNYDINSVSQPGYVNSITVLECTVVDSGALKDVGEISHSAVFGEAVFGYAVFGETE